MEVSAPKSIPDPRGVEFLNLIGHELAQPLTAAIGANASLVQRTDLTRGDQALLLGIVARNLDQLHALLNSLRVFSEASSGDLELNRDPVLVESLFKETKEDFDDARTERSLKTSCPEDLVIKVDVMMFRQVLSNLIANAIKFSPPGSSINVEAHLMGDEVLVSVKNESGPGFDADESERIFDKSVRLKTEARGLGLGLFVARAIVDAHDGRIEARSKVGEGATFEVAIPA